MNRLLFLVFLLTSCLSDAQIDKKKAFLLLQSSSPEIPAYLAGGAIAESEWETVYMPITAADLASSYVNLINPGTRDAVVGVAPTFVDEGDYNVWRFNGTTQYLNSQTNFLTNSTLVIWQDNSLGVYTAGSTKVLIRPLNSPNTRLTISTNTDLVGPSTNSILAVRAGDGAYRNGKKLGTMGSFAAGTDYPVFIGARNNVGTAANFASGNILFFGIANVKLTDAQLEALYESLRNSVATTNTSYRNTVLALNPIAYYTMGQKIGKFFHDESGNQAAAEAVSDLAAPSGITIGHSGPTGKGLSAKGTTTFSRIQTQDDWATDTGINLNNFSWCSWVYNVNTDAQARPLNMYSGTGNEYFAPEIRTGTLVVYSKENGVTWNTSPSISFPNQTWTHVCACNDNANSKIIVYVNGTKYEYAKSSSGFADTTPDPLFPYMLQSMTGYMAHSFFMNGIITQEQVNTLID